MSVTSKTSHPEFKPSLGELSCIKSPPTPPHPTTRCHDTGVIIKLWSNWSQETIRFWLQIVGTCPGITNLMLLSTITGSKWQLDWIKIIWVAQSHFLELEAMFFVSSSRDDERHAWIDKGVGGASAWDWFSKEGNEDVIVSSDSEDDDSGFCGDDDGVRNKTLVLCCWWRWKCC